MSRSVVRNAIRHTLRRGGITVLDAERPALTALSSGAASLAAGGSADEALQAVVEAVRVAAAADVGVVRVAEDGVLVARAVAGPAALVAELEGSRLAAAPPAGEITELAKLPPEARAAAHIAAAQIALVLRAFGGEEDRPGSPEQLGLVAEALAAGADDARSPERIARVAASAAGADACLIWRAEGPESLELVVSSGTLDPSARRELE